MIDFQNKVAFITGGVSGIGLGIAKALLEEGAVVAVSYMRETHRDSALEELTAIKGAKVHAFQLDVADRAAVERIADEIERQIGPIDFLFNNAGANLFGSLESATYDDWDWLMSVNLGGTVNGIKAILPKMQNRRSGYIVNTGSMASFISGPNAGIYTTSKAAVRGLTECLRYSVAQYGINVSLICPGLTQSNIHQAEENRPSKYSNSGHIATAEAVNGFKKIMELGMDPVEVGRKTIAAMKKKEFYIFTHPEFRDEIEEMFQEILKAVPTEGTDPRRTAFEISRRKRYRDALNSKA